MTTKAQITRKIEVTTTAAIATQFAALTALTELAK